MTGGVKDVDLLLKHSRKKLLLPIALIQIIGAAIIYIVAYLLRGEYPTSQLPVFYLGIVGGLLAYVPLASLFVFKFFRPEYFRLHADGSAKWTPWFSQKVLQYPAGVGYALGAKDMQFAVAIERPDAPKSIPLPPTLTEQKAIKKANG